MGYSQEDALVDREKRIIFQKKLINKYNMPLVIIRVIYTGINRDNEITRDVVRKIDEIATCILMGRIHFKLFRITAEGPMVIMMVNKSVLSLKKDMVEIEEKHMLGGCVDIDVYDTYGNPVRRQQIGYGNKKCPLCNGDARICAETLRHNEKPITDYVINTHRTFIESLEKHKI